MRCGLLSKFFDHLFILLGAETCGGEVANMIDSLTDWLW